MLTPSSRALTERRHELIPGHCPQTLITRIVRKLYPRDTKHIRNQLWCDRNARTSDASEKERYRTIYPVHVVVKLLDQYERTCDRDITQWLPSPTVYDRGKVNVGKVRQYDLTFRMNASSRKVLQECLVGIIITEPKRGVELEDKEALEWRRFRAGVDVRLGAIETSNVNKQRGRERETIRKVPSGFKYQEYWKEVHMHGKCMNMWHTKENASWAQPNPNLLAHI